MNTIIDPTLDEKNGRENTRANYGRRILANIRQYLVDIWRIKHSTTRQFTWLSNNKKKTVIFCLLDYFLLSKILQNYITSTKIEQGLKPDHSSVTIHLANCQ